MISERPEVDTIIIAAKKFPYGAAIVRQFERITQETPVLNPDQDFSILAKVTSQFDLVARLTVYLSSDAAKFPVAVELSIAENKLRQALRATWDLPQDNKSVLLNANAGVFNESGEEIGRSELNQQNFRFGLRVASNPSFATWLSKTDPKAGYQLFSEISISLSSTLSDSLKDKSIFKPSLYKLD